MSKRGIEKVFKKAITDREFRSKLFMETESVAADLDISEDEVKVLKAIQLDDQGDFVDIRPLDSIDPELIKRLMDDGVKACHTLFARCYQDIEK
jgi:predicted aldo/keto reductase-like oxidoreductase